MAFPDLITRFRTARSDSTVAVLEGFHAIKHAIRFGADIEVVASSDPAELDRLAARLAPDVASALKDRATLVTPDVFDQLSPTPPETGVIGIAARRVTTPAALAVLPLSESIVLLESPAHSGNVGAVIRVAAAAGAAAVITTGAMDPWNPGAIRGSAGLHFALPVERVDHFDIADRLLIAIDPDGEPLGATSVPRDATLAFGSERAGLSPELLSRASARVRIPMEPGVSSLNLATAVAIVLYHGMLRS